MHDRVTGTALRATLAVVMVAAFSVDASAQPAPATEPPDRFYVAAGAILGVSAHYFHAAFAIDGGVRLGCLPFWAHGELALGSGAAEETGGGAFRHAVGGVDARTSFRYANMFAGIAAGYTWQRFDSFAKDENFGMIGGRVGFDVGSRDVTLRATAALYAQTRHENGCEACGTPMSLDLVLQLVVHF